MSEPCCRSFSRLVGVAALVCGVLPAQERSQQLQQQVANYLEPLAEIGLWSGVVLIAAGGEVVVEQAFGEADRDGRIGNTVDTRFKLMSVSKTFTGVTVLQLVERGLLDLADPVGEHVPNWPEVWQAVTVRDLLDHRSGIPNRESGWGAVSRRLWQERAGPVDLVTVWQGFAPQAGVALESEPGARFAYSNFNTVLAGLIAEIVGGKPYPELVAERLLSPAGLENTGFDDGSRQPGLAVGYLRGADGEPVLSAQNMAHIRPAGGYWSTARDLYRFDRALRGDTLLSAASRRTLVTPRAGDYACCFIHAPVHGHACIQHSGGSNGYVADFLRFVEDDACVIVLSNYAFAPIQRLSSDLAAMVFGLEVELPVAVDGEDLARWAGSYAWSDSQFTVVQRSGGTLQTFTVAPGVDRVGARLLLPLGEGRFLPAMGKAVLQFEQVEGARRIRRSYDGGVNLLPAAPPDLAPWQALTGTWRATLLDRQAPPVTGSAEVSRRGDRLRLAITGLWPSASEIVPVSAECALALYAPGGGVVLRRDGERLAYRYYTGDTVVLSRQ